MCGIAGFYLRDPNLAEHVDLNGLLDDLLLGIEHRGRDATGFVAISDEGVAEWQKAATEAKTFIKWRRPAPFGTRVILGHTRFATQGLPAFIENNHPIKRGPYFIVHNGHVINDVELFKNAERARFGQVDSEAIAARLSSLKDLSALSEVMAEIDGDAAVAAVDERDPSRLVVAKGSMSPLYVYDGRAIVIFCSLKDVIEKAHKKYIGHIAQKRLDFLGPGEQIEWREGKKIESKFEIKTRVFTSGWNYQGNELTTPHANSALWDDAWEEKKEYACDNCTASLSFRELSWRYDPNEKYTFSLCSECTSLWDDGFFDEADRSYMADESPAERLFVADADGNEIVEVAGGEAVDPTEPTTPAHGGFFDEYEEANNAILHDVDSPAFSRRIRGLFGI